MNVKHREEIAEKNIRRAMKQGLTREQSEREHGLTRWAFFEDPVLAAGFTQIPNVIIYDRELTPQARWLYSLLLSYAWNDPFAWPGMEEIAEIGNVKTLDTLRKWRKELEAKNLIETIQRGPTKSNLYVFKSLSAAYPEDPDRQHEEARRDYRQNRSKKAVKPPLDTKRKKSATKVTNVQKQPSDDPVQKDQQNTEKSGDTTGISIYRKIREYHIPENPVGNNTKGKNTKLNTNVPESTIQKHRGRSPEQARPAKRIEGSQSAASHQTDILQGEGQVAAASHRNDSPSAEKRHDQKQSQLFANVPEDDKSFSGGQGQHTPPGSARPPRSLPKPTAIADKPRSWFSVFKSRMEDIGLKITQDDYKRTGFHLKHLSSREDVSDHLMNRVIFNMVESRFNGYYPSPQKCYDYLVNVKGAKDEDLRPEKREIV